MNTGAVRLEPGEKRKVDPYIPAPKAKAAVSRAIRQIGTGLDPLAVAYLKGRGISENTAVTFGLSFARAYFPDLEKETHGLAFPYYEKAKLLGH